MWLLIPAIVLPPLILNLLQWRRDLLRIHEDKGLGFINRRQLHDDHDGGGTTQYRQDPNEELLLP